MLPVINENDTTATDEISFGDNDFLAAQVAVLVGADELVLLTDIDGLYTADPRIAPRRAHRRARSTDFAALERARDRPHDLAAGLRRDALEGRRRRDGHGRRHRDGDLQRAARGGAGGGAGAASARARASRRARRATARFKLWLKYAKPSRGTLVIDAGAARAVREGSASLLPVGVVEVLGEFDAGDAVEIAAGAERRAAAPARSARASATTPPHELRRVHRAEVGGGARDPAARDRGGGAPRLPRARLSGVATRSYPGHGRSPSTHRSPTSCRAAKRAARALARARHRDARTPRCRRSPTRSRTRADEILAANERDMQAGRESGHRRRAARPPAPRRGAHRRDRRRACAQIAALADPVGEVIDGQRLPNGLDVRKVRVPLGVVAVVYEARPNVTIDAAALCLKSGNAIVLRGSSLGRALQRGARADRRRGGGRRGPAGRLRRASSPAAGARSSPSSRPRATAST